MSYLTLKFLHVMLAVTSIGGFLLRGFWHLRHHELRHAKIVRIIPHIVDTMLLATGLTLMILTRSWPSAQTWLAIKLALIIAYILCGIRAFRATRKNQQLTWFVLAILSASAVVMVALKKPVLW